MKRYGLIGKSLGHSFSKSYFSAFFEANELDASYDNIEIQEIEQVRAVLEVGYAGLNVTIPYKESILPFLDELSEEAQQIGAVNVVQFKDGKVIGHNTDAYGFQQSIKPFLTNKHERAIILGTGGASKAVSFALEQIGVDLVTISRTPMPWQFGWNEINVHMLHACKLIVNCTPIGMFPAVNESPALPYELLSPEHLAVDLIYNPSKSSFLQKAELAGAQIMNGESMLKLQAAKAWEIWAN